MNRKQRIAILMVLVLVTLNAMFPPRVRVQDNSSTTRAFILLHVNEDRDYEPTPERKVWRTWRVSIDLPRLVAHTIILLTLGGICVVCLHGGSEASSTNPEGGSTNSEVRSTK